MLLSTTSSVQGREITQYLGIVTGETIIGANAIKDMMAQLTDFFGGRSNSYEKVVSEARNTALEEMKQKARALGANGVIGIDIDYETIGGSMIMVTACGTAIRYV